MKAKTSEAGSPAPGASGRRTAHEEAADTTPSRSPAPARRAGSGSRRRLTREERRDQLLGAAAELIVEGGLRAVTMEGVAERAGVSKALPYNHFANSDELLVELYRREVAEHRIRVREGVATTTGNASRAGFQALFQTLEGRHVVFNLQTQPTTTPGPLRDQQLAFQKESESYYAARYQERLGVSESTALIAACIMLTSLDGTIRAWTKGYGSKEEIEAVFVTMIDGGLRALRNSERSRRKVEPS